MSYSLSGGWQDQYHFPHHQYDGNMYEEDVADSGWYVDADDIRYYLDSNGVEYYPIEGVHLEEADAFGVEYVVDEYEVPYFAYQDLAPELRQQFATVDRYEETMMTPVIRAENTVPNSIVCDHGITAETAISEVSDGHLLDGHHAPRHNHHDMDKKKKHTCSKKKKKRRSKERSAEDTGTADKEELFAKVGRLLKEKENAEKHITSAKHSHDRRNSKKRVSNKTRSERTRPVSSAESGSRDNRRRTSAGQEGNKARREGSSRSLARRSVSMNDGVHEHALQSTRSKHRRRQRHSHPNKKGMGDHSLKETSQHQRRHAASEHSESQESSNGGSEGQDSSERHNSRLDERSMSSSARRRRPVTRHRPRSLHARLNQRQMARKTYAKAIEFYKDKEDEEQAKRREAKELLKELLEEQQQQQQLSQPQLQGEADPTLDHSQSRFGGLGGMKGGSLNNVSSMRITPALHGTQEMAMQSMFRLANAAQMATSAVYNTTVHTATTAANVGLATAHMAADTTVGIGKLAVNTTHAVGDGIRSRSSIFVGAGGGTRPRGSMFVTSLRGSKNPGNSSNTDADGQSRSDLLLQGTSKSMQMREHLASLREEFGDTLDDLDEEEETEAGDSVVPPLTNLKPETVSETKDEDNSASTAASSLSGKEDSISEPGQVLVPLASAPDSQHEEPPVSQARVMAATMA